MNKPLLSICCITYNHVNFIEDTLKGFLFQKTNFEYNIIINDDASNDGTTELLKKYKKQYANKINLIIQEKNQYSQGVRGIAARFTFPHAHGKYIALCEGDDYWTDPLKLQKQVDFLEANVEYGICFHNVHEESSFDSNKNRIVPNVSKDFNFTLEDYILNNRTATCSIMFKKEYLSSLPTWYEKLPFGDWGIILLVLYNSNNKGMVLNEIMGVYRIHEGGIHGGLRNSKKGLIKAYLQHLTFNKIISKNLLNDKVYRKLILKKYINTNSILIKLYKNDDNKFGVIKFEILSFYYKLLIKLINKKKYFRIKLRNL